MFDLRETFETLRRALDGRIPVTRFAPSPTGYLHLGHVASMLYVWGVARALGGRIILRLEDHDRGRCREDFANAIRADLAWLGFVADEGWSVPSTVAQDMYIQSQCNDRYRKAIDILCAHNLAYGCTCTRKEIASTTENPDELHYPGTCRDKGLALTDHRGWRIRLGTEDEMFHDGFLGLQTQNPARQCGDLLARDRTNQWTYQFAVVQDDLAHGVNLVVRGQDLTSSTGRQIALRRLVSSEPPPVFAHHPLVMDPSGKKLSKRTLAQSVVSRRLAGEVPEVILREAALMITDGPSSLADLLQFFYDHAHERS